MSKIDPRRNIPYHKKQSDITIHVRREEKAGTGLFRGKLFPPCHGKNHILKSYPKDTGPVVCGQKGTVCLPKKYSKKYYY
ncbi:hypothetical protein L0665_02360 [Methanogenium marinum]|uniref:Uncharacterized protein n=1 Tax=Methanogenium marinum TaxID=348610 RepID=A0A9Q4KUF7_9EURY|nr:hypothetical protein [Methanogenium marinum]MDE4907461.1 hypothetical protein [Methanogenium marinum]